MPLHPKIYSFLCACFAALGASVFGYDLAVIASVLIAPDFIRISKIEAGSSYEGFIVSSMLLGAVAGSLPAGLIADAFSRRVSIVTFSTVFLIGGTLQTAANGREMMLAGRFFAGTGIGGMAMLAPLYQSEIAHPRQRGRLISTFQLFIGIGATVAGWIAYGASNAFPNTGARWRLPLGLQMAPAVPLALLTFLLPESPRWLVTQGREDEALKALARLHARGDINDPFVRSEFEEIAQVVSQEKLTATDWNQIFGDRTNLRKVFLGIVLQFSVQMTGVSAIQYYSPTVYNAVGFSNHKTLLIQGINNVNGILGEICCILFLDRVGRRIPLIWGNILSGTTFAIAAALARQFVIEKGSQGQGIAFVAMTFVYNFVFSACIGPLSWVYPAEIMSTSIRAKATAITTTASWLANFMIGQVSPTAFKQINWKYYLVFTICSFTNAMVFYFFFPETKGRTLEEMDNHFRYKSWIVPLAKSSTNDVERDLRPGYGQGDPHVEGDSVNGKDQTDFLEKA